MFGRKKRTVKEEVAKELSDKLGISEEEALKTLNEIQNRTTIFNSKFIDLLATNEKFINALCKNEKLIDALAKKLDFNLTRRLIIASGIIGGLTLGAGTAGAKLVLTDKFVELDGQKFYPSAVGAYDVIVLKDNTYVWAEDRFGRKIAEGVSGEDDAEVIQSAIDSLTLGRQWKETVVLKGKFKLTKRIQIRNYTVLIIDGVLEAQSDDFLIYAKNVQHFDIIGGIFNGNRNNISGDSYPFNIAIDSCQNFRIDNIWSIYARGNSVYIKNSTWFVITRCKFEHNGRPHPGTGDGIKILSSTNFVIADCLSQKNEHCCFDVENSYRFTIANCVAEESLTRIGFTIHSDKYYAIVGCVSRRNALDGIRIENSQYGTITANTVTENYENGILLFTTGVQDCMENIIASNTIINNNRSNGDWDGIRICRDVGEPYYTKNNLIYGNLIIRGTYQRYGIRIYDAKALDNIVVLNRVIAGGRAGNILDNGTRTIIKYNFGYRTENSGIVTITGDGTTQTFTVDITHGLVSDKLTARITLDRDGTVDKVYLVDKDGDGFKETIRVQVTFATAPADGEQVPIYWYAEVV